MPGKRPITGPIVRSEARDITPQPYDDSIGFESIPDECKKPEQRVGRHRADVPTDTPSPTVDGADAARGGGYHGSLLNVDNVAGLAAAATIAGLFIVMLCMWIGLI